MTDETGQDTVDATSQRRGPTLILGLGNAILCDDGVGIKAARYIAELGPNPDVVVKEAELAGFALIDLLEGFDRAVVIDAVKLRERQAGRRRRVREQLARALAPPRRRAPDRPADGARDGPAARTTGTQRRPHRGRADRERHDLLGELHARCGGRDSGGGAHVALRIAAAGR